jgi:hypothetical protein
MKRILVVLLLVAIPICYFLYTGEQGAVWAYQQFAGRLYKMKFDAAQNDILPSAEGDFQQARSFYQRAYGKLREGFGYPKYEMIRKEKSGEKGFTFKMEQTVPADTPGSTSAFGTTLLTYVHDAEMEFQGWQWKVKKFQIYSKLLSAGSSTRTAPPAVSKVKKEDAKPLDLASNFRKTFENVKSNLTAPAKATPVSKPAKIPEADLKTFQLKNGQTVRGKIVGDDPVYYTLEDENGKQVILIKEDIA